MKILAISGSLRAGSYNTALARAAAELAPDGVEIEVYDGLGLMPHYDEDLDQEGIETPRPSRSSATHRRGRRAPPGHAGVQRLDHGRPEERDRLGLRAAPRRAGSGTRPSPSPARRTGEYGAIWAQQDLRRDPRNRRRPRRRRRLPASLVRTRRSTSPDAREPARRRAPPHPPRGARPRAAPLRRCLSAGSSDGAGRGREATPSGNFARPESPR